MKEELRHLVADLENSTVYRSGDHFTERLAEHLVVPDSFFNIHSSKNRASGDMDIQDPKTWVEALKPKDGRRIKANLDIPGKLYVRFDSDGTVPEDINPNSKEGVYVDLLIREAKLKAVKREMPEAYATGLHRVSKAVKETRELRKKLIDNIRDPKITDLRSLMTAKDSSGFGIGGRRKTASLLITEAALITACSLTAVTPTTPDAPTATGPRATEVSTEEKLAIYGGFKIGERGVGKITWLELESNPDPKIVSEVARRLAQAVPGTIEDSVNVYIFDMQGETGKAPFIIAQEKDKLGAYVGFWVDENGVQLPPADGRIYVFYPLGVFTMPDGTQLIGATSIDGQVLYLPELFRNTGGEFTFFPPYTDSAGGQFRPAEKVKDSFASNISYGVATATAAPTEISPTGTPYVVTEVLAINTPEPTPPLEIKQFKVCPEIKDFRDCVITKSDLLDGAYFRWLQTLPGEISP